MMIQRGPFSLREMTADDLPMVLSWRNQRRVKAFMFTRHDITWAEHLAWFERMQCSPGSPQMMFEVDGRPVGVVGFSGVGNPDGIATWGFYLGTADTPKGTGTRMLALALELAFGPMEVRKLCSEVLVSNEASIAVHARLGFRKEGLPRPHRLQEMDEGNVIFLALFSEDWDASGPGIMKALFVEGGDG